MKFDDYYYATSCGRPYQRDDEWLNFFGTIAEKIKSEINPTTVLDAGCALGFLVEKMRKNDIQAFGCDISEYAISQTHESIKPYCWIASLTDPIQNRYDLIVSIEVLEHMNKAESELALKNLCNASDDILFSSTPFDYKETTHVNVNNPDYWSEQFAKHGFFRDINFDASFITPWAVRYRRRNEPVHRLVKEYEQIFWRLKKENSDLRVLASELESKIPSLEKEVEIKTNEINEIRNSESWKFIQKLLSITRIFRRTR